MSQVLSAPMARMFIALLSASAIWTVQCRPVLPDTMIAGYTNQATPQVILNTVKQGCNVLFWSFMEMEGNEITTKGLVQGSVTADKIQPVHAGLVAMGRTDVVHMLSIGGWNVQHHIAGSCGGQNCSGAAYAASFRKFNADMVKNVPGFPGFAGIDWDIEGVNQAGSPSNMFKEAELQIILDMSESLRQDFLVSMVPPQSYFDCHQPNFDLSLQNAATSTPGFHYHAKNIYALLYAKCPKCFDVVMIQIYEGWSRAGFDLYWAGKTSNIGAEGWPRHATEQNMSDVVLENARCLVEGFDVDFGGFMGVGKAHIALPAEKVVIGLGIWPGVKGSFKVPYFTGSSAGAAWCKGLLDSYARIRGFAYWTISSDTPTSSYAGDLNTAMKGCSPTVSV